MGQERKIFYAEKDRLGSGSFATVYKGFYQDGDKGKIDAAVKVLKHYSTSRNFLLEAYAMQTLSHENIIRLYGFEEHDDFRGFPTLWIAMELCTGSLDPYMKGDRHLELRLGDDELRFSSVEITLMHQITKGVAHLHSNNYVHKDLKPDNILLHWQSPTKFTAKLADFGLVRRLEGGLVEPGDSYSGNAATMSPERASDLNAYGTPSLDIYSLGIVFFMLLTKGKNPFGCHKDVEQLKKNKEFGIYCLTHDLIKRRQDAVCLIKKMISKIPSERPTAEQVLQHPTFLTQWDKMCFLNKFYDKEGLQLATLQQKLENRDPFGLKNWTAEFQAEDLELKFDPIPYQASNNPLHALALAFREANIDESVRADEWERKIADVLEPFEERNEPPLEVVRDNILAKGHFVQYSLITVFERNVPDFVPLVKLSMLKGDDLFSESLQPYGNLHNAIECNDEERVMKILAEKCEDVNDKNPDGNTALHLACEKGSPEIVTILLEHQAPWDIPNNAGLTPLHRAARRGDPAIVRALLENNQENNLSAHLVTGWTPLHEASSQGHAELVLSLLGETHEWVKATDSKKRTPLHVADNAMVAKHLLDKEPDLLHQVDQNGMTPILNACEINRVGLITYLLERGATLKTKDLKGNTPLHVAVESSAADAVQIVLQHGADVVDMKNGDDMTPLFCAVRRDSTRIVETLLDFGASINQVNLGYETPLKTAIKQGKTEIAKLLIDKGADLDTQDLLLGRTALHVAVKEGNLEITEALLENGANPNLQDISDRCTALHYAILCKSGETAEAFVHLLLRYKADVKLRNRYGDTVFRIMASLRRWYLEDVLIKAGADETVEKYNAEIVGDITELEEGASEGSTLDDSDFD